MGVPGFFKWCRMRMKNLNVIYRKLQISKNKKYRRKLYIDANGLVHPQAKYILDKYKKIKNKKILEKLIIRRAINNVKFLGKSTNADFIFIALDGVAPMAKMNQQRRRRFKAINDQKIINKLKQKYGIKTDSRWSNASITPGTKFMMKLAKAFKKAIKDKLFGNIKCVFSSSNVPQEGEHKILHHLRKSKKNDINIIYGLDADLFFLSLASQQSNIFLMREASQFGNSGHKEHINNNDDLDEVFDDNFCFVDIDKFKDAIKSMIKEKMILSVNKMLEKMLDDFIFLCYFIGNDFIPHLPSIDVYHGGMDLLFSEYIKVFQKLKENLIKRNPIKINQKFLILLLKNLTKNEDFFLTKKVNTIFQKRYNIKNKAKNPSDFDKEFFKFNNLHFDIDDPVSFHEGKKSDWKYRYYEHYFNLTTDQADGIDLICKDYLTGLNWVSYYYFEECVSWSYYYRENYSPLMEDLLSFLERNPNFFNNVKFKKDTNISPFIQLLAVLPPDCYYLLPKSYQYLMTSPESPVYDLYPRTFKEDLLYKSAWWMGIPILPKFDFKRITKATSKLKITSKEKSRLLK